MKPWYIHPNKVRDTCCCRYHVEFSYYYEAFRNYRLQFQPTNEAPQMHATDFIKSLLCERGEGDIFYKMKCVKNKCDNCLNLKKWKDYIYDSSDDMIKQKMFKYVSFPLPHGGESRRIELVEDEVPIKEFINTFKTRQIYQYVQHSHMARWQDLQF